MDFFEDELVRHRYDWKKVVEEYLYSGDQPLINSMLSGREWIKLIFASRVSIDSEYSWAPLDPPGVRVRDVQSRGGDGSSRNGSNMLR